MGRVALVAIVALVAAGSAKAKLDASVRLSAREPRVGEPVQVVIQAVKARGASCRMRLVAVAPGIDGYHALAALVDGGYWVWGPTGQSFHRLVATRRVGFLVHTQRSSSTTWRATVEFARSGRWQLIVPNVCADGYTGPPPAARVVSVR